MGAGASVDATRTDAALLTAVRAVAGRSPEGLERATWTPLGPSTNLTTQRLDRVTGVLADGTPWSVIAKVIRPASASPVWPSIPEAFHAEVLATLNWLDEPRLYRCGLAECMPDGFRMPRLLAVEEAEARIVLWLEDVADVVPWDLERYRRAATALGRMSGRWVDQRAVNELGLGPRGLRSMFFGKVCNVDLPLQADDTFWADPAVAAAVDPRHRVDLFRLADAAPSLLDRRAALPVGLCHGDACPSNLLEPGDGAVVAIDWSYGHVGPLGSDLGQLVAGRFESGEADDPNVDEIAEVSLAAYIEGLASEDVHPDPTAVEEAFATHLAIRSAFSALVVEGMDGDERRSDVVRQRAGLGRFAIDLALRHATRG